MINNRFFLLSFVSGILLGLAYAVSAWFGVAIFVAYVPLLVVFVNAEKESGWSGRIRYAFITLVLYHGLTNWWIASWQKQTDPYLFATGIALLVIHPLLLLIPFAVLSFIRKRLGPKKLLILFPFILTAFEWLHGQTDFSYPWLTSGYALVHSPLAQVAEYIGVYGLTFMLAAVNSALAWMLLYTESSKKMAFGVTALALIGGWAIAGTMLEKRIYDDPSVQSVAVMLVQPNENPWDKWQESRQQLSVHMSLSDSAAQALTKPDLFVWCETALPFVIKDRRYEIEWTGLKAWIARNQVPVLTGVADRIVYADNQAPPSARVSAADPFLRYDVFNSAYLISTDTTRVGIHRKSMLTPFAERLPFADQLTFAMDWMEWGVGISAWGKGYTRDPLPLIRGGDTVLRIGTIICIESIYPEVSRDFVRAGANALCVITNDAWYNGTAGPRQHYEIAQMRAIETRRPIFRCGNSGVTGIITPDGKSVSEIPAETSGVAFVHVKPATTITPYVRFGDVIPKICMLLTAFVVLIARIPAFQRILPFRFTSL